MPTGDIPFPAPVQRRGGLCFEPSAALAILDGLVGRGPEPEAAWDAAWIACLTGSPRWAETARLEFARATARPGAGSPGRCHVVADMRPSADADPLEGATRGFASTAA